MAWRAQRARNIGLIGDYVSDYFSESSALDSEHSNLESEEEIDQLVSAQRVSRSKVRAPPRYPRPHSHLLRNRDGQRARGNKHARRWENSVFINTLYQIPEEELERDYSILPEHSSSFTRLHMDSECMQMWQAFTSRPEEEQGVILRDSRRRTDKVRTSMGDTAECRYGNIDRHIRNMMKHNKHLPQAFLSAVETELTLYFTIDQHILVIAAHPDTYYRLLVHGVCQYMGLTSTTLHKDGVSLMLLECCRDVFTPPPISLITHLSQHHPT